MRADNVIRSLQLIDDSQISSQEPQSVFSQSYILMKIQQAYCLQSFSQSKNSVEEAVEALALMSESSGYPSILGYNLV